MFGKGDSSSSFLNSRYILVMITRQCGDMGGLPIGNEYPFTAHLQG